MEVNREEYAKQYIELSEKEGSVLTIHLAPVEPSKSGHLYVAPIINMHSPSPIDTAFLIQAIDTAKEKLFEKPEVKETYELISKFKKLSEEINLGGGDTK